MPAQRRSTSLEGRDDDDSEGSPSYNSDKDEYVLVKLTDIRKEVQCPICLGIIRKTRTVMECLHRFCRECIDKAMRLGKNECPACRAHCASRRSLRDDPKYDALIAAIYPNLDKYEEEEFALHEEDNYRNKEVQASIAQTFLRQSEAVARRRTTAKATAAAIVKKAHGKFRNVQNQNISSRGKSRSKQQRKSISADDDENIILEHPSSHDEESQDFMQSRHKRKFPSFSPKNLSNINNGIDNSDEIGHFQAEMSREATGASCARGGNTEGLVWGRGGARSHMRYGSISGSNGKNSRAARVVKMVDYLLSKAREENENEFDVQVTLLPFDKDTNLPSLERPYICCCPTVSVNQLCKLLAFQLCVPAEDIEIVMKKKRILTEMGSQTKFSRFSKLGKGKSELDTSENKGDIEVVDQEATLSRIFNFCSESRGNLVLMYRRCSL